MSIQEVYLLPKMKEETELAVDKANENLEETETKEENKDLPRTKT